MSDACFQDDFIDNIDNDIYDLVLFNPDSGLDFTEKVEILNDMIMEMMMEGLHLQHIIPNIINNYNITCEEFNIIYRETSVAKKNIVCVLPARNSSDVMHISSSLFIQAFHSAICKLLVIIIKDYKISIINAALMIAYCFSGICDDTRSDLVGYSIRAGLKNNKYSNFIRTQLQLANLTVK